MVSLHLPMTNDGDNLSIDAYVVQSGPVLLATVNWHKCDITMLPLSIEVQPHLLAVWVHPYSGVQAFRRQHRQYSSNLHNHHHNNTRDNVSHAVTMTKSSQVHHVHLINVENHQTAADHQTKPQVPLYTATIYDQYWHSHHSVRSCCSFYNPAERADLWKVSKVQVTLRIQTSIKPPTGRYRLAASVCCDVG